MRSWNIAEGLLPWGTHAALSNDQSFSYILQRSQIAVHWLRMTTPTERLRSLRWGWNLLDTLGQDQGIDPALSERARHLASSYPRPESLLAALDLSGPGLSADFAAIIEESRRLFALVTIADSALPTMQTHATRVLRHFPSHAVCLDMMEAARTGLLRRWLAPED